MVFWNTPSNLQPAVTLSNSAELVTRAAHQPNHEPSLLLKTGQACCSKLVKHAASKWSNVLLTNPTMSQVS
jgi:hypothetical protein